MYIHTVIASVAGRRLSVFLHVTAAEQRPMMLLVPYVASSMQSFSEFKFSWKHDRFQHNLLPQHWLQLTLLA